LIAECSRFRQNEIMKGKPFVAAVASFAGFLVLLLGTAYALRQRPILFHLFSDTGCACGDYHEQVTGLIAKNPFRDFTPEKTQRISYKTCVMALVPSMSACVSMRWMGTVFRTGDLRTVTMRETR
jgi:hypothetical protein